MNIMVALLRREIWEHRSIYVVPAVIGLVVTLMSLTGQVVVSAFDQAVDLAVFGASNLGARERSAAITVLMTAISTPFILAMSVLSVFYLLDCLYAERKDRSILFWRSLPVTDAETVLSKLATALIVIPLVTFLLIVATTLLVLTISGIWLSLRGGSAAQLIWSAAPLAENWLAALVFLLALPLWLSPFAGWFLLVSSWTRRSPLLVAFLPLVVAPMLERILLGTSWLRDAIFVRSGSMPLFRGVDAAEYLFHDGDQLKLGESSATTLLPLVDLGKFFSSPALWAGFAICALLTAGAIYMRRYRDES
ncbi:MAG TPA: ABC-2 transporter permease [Woeseiaceae bacterium]|nr:ABC-2 transporter permease [Woeseiaceae bacterium]